jgi:cell division protein ZapE
LDYIQLCNKCDWVILSQVPKLDAEDRNLAKRFQTLVDILYDKNIGLALSSDVKPEDIYIDGDGNKEFRRTVSRIYEMTHKEWLNKIKNKGFKKLLNL